MNAAPGLALSIVAAEVLYLLALRTLARRGVPVGGRAPGDDGAPAGDHVARTALLGHPSDAVASRRRPRTHARRMRVTRTQIACWHAGMALWTLALLGPPGALAEESLTAHMAEHLLLADLGAPLLLAGLRAPVLFFFLPRPVLVALARRRRLRAVLRTLRRPLVALPLFVLVLYGWHIGPAFEAAVRNPLVHAAQHASFVGSGMLVWWAALEPQHRRMRGELWKAGHILGARMASMMIGMAFVVIRTPVYSGAYDADRPFGLSPLADQQTAGGLMISVDVLIMVFALAFFFFRAAQQHDLDTAAPPPSQAALVGRG